jgi:hypothetical protein
MAKGGYLLRDFFKNAISQTPDSIGMCLTSGEIYQENRKFAA